MASDAHRLRLLGRWEGELHDLMSEMEEKSHLVACRDIHAAVRLAWRETRRASEGYMARAPEPATEGETDAN